MNALDSIDNTAFPQLKELQGVLLELLKVIDKICREKGLRYYLFYGTLLGAIRHKGFIPWDDDADIVMPRADYEKFIQISEVELGNGYFIQTYKSDPFYRNPFAKLRKNNTTCIVQEHAHIRMHQGVFVDIFPLDVLPRSKVGKWCMWNMTHIFERLQAFTCARLPNRLRMLYPIQCFWKLLFKPSFFARITNRLAKLLSGSSADYISVLDPDHYDLTHNVLPISSFAPGRRVVFQDAELMVPNRAEELLSHQYGDYMSLPPIEMRRPIHAKGTLVDLQRDYRHYLPNIYGKQES